VEVDDVDDVAILRATGSVDDDILVALAKFERAAVI
jgi:hypothetical protein